VSALAERHGDGGSIRKGCDELGATARVGTYGAAEVEKGAASIKRPGDAVERSRDRQPAPCVEDAHTGIPLIASLTAGPEKALRRSRGHGQCVLEADRALCNAGRLATCGLVPGLADHVHAAIVSVDVAHACNDGLNCRPATVNRNYLAAQVVTALSR